MIRVIAEYQLAIGLEQIVTMPLAEFIGVTTDQESPDEPIIYAIHEQRHDSVEMFNYKVFMSRSNVLEFPPYVTAGDYVGTVKIRGGTVPLHIFITYFEKASRQMV